MSENFVERARYLCSLGGAAATVTALPGGVPILHSASGCAGNFAWTQNGGSGLQVGGYCGSLTVPSSNIGETEVVFGGEERLREQIASTLKVMHGGLYVVVTGCVPEVIGDDIFAVVNDFRSEGVSIIGAATGGFRGDSYWGYDLVLQALVKDYLAKGIEKAKGRVNLWGVVPYMDPFWRGNLEGARRLLELIGLEVNSFFTPADTLEGIQAAASAELNIVASDLYGQGAARLFEEKHGTPFVTAPLPIGVSASEEFLRQVGAALSLDEGLVERVIAREKKEYYQILDPLTDCYNDLDLQRYAVVVGDANYAVALTRFLADDLGWLPALTVVTDRVQESEQSAIAGRVGQLASGFATNVVFESDGSQVLGHLNRVWPQPAGQKYYNSFSPAFVVGSSLERELALQIGAPHLSVSFPVANRAVLDRGYTGFRGGLRLAEDLFGAIVVNR
ncbi:Nitrogenase vanadium-cofactor synthesis protein VnfN [Citrifermentans bremense]|uniref:Nitrogenase vanadium-cofactor synthesis protein VnfN n=1 Tax=Citrifermentans bremense TaxID=60035 RepID=A0A6S6M009_9BACT|nr:nitrogenase component 1 [Citrifermentans bremense]BCG47682.1 Nitrogenase vanadium-cofactor synthesis protein VnfN [Citrifermentans bremense]